MSELVCKHRESLSEMAGSCPERFRFSGSGQGKLCLHISAEIGSFRPHIANSESEAV